MEYVEEEIWDSCGQPTEYPLSQYEFNPNIKLCDLTNTRCNKIEGLDQLKELKQLILRQNLITKIENLQEQKNLIHLDLYDNQISSIENLPHESLTYLDLSFNNIRQITNLEGCNKLKELFLVHNKITNMDVGLEPLIQLQLLELGANRIRVSLFQNDYFGDLHYDCRKLRILNP
eukprot:TRINITY_DN2385_c0_g1_i1.p1 TRINITY_DN2385_c0_g1~~TRINITY_DN2385_c0_g1_i1.p1  ORF type:complete len:175 (-),score=37.49 TRINITY_DN2385_c0_g1_i1:605-1129(-)